MTDVTSDLHGETNSGTSSRSCSNENHHATILKMEATCSSETYIDFYLLHGVISQKMELFIVNAERTSNPNLSDLKSCSCITVSLIDVNIKHFMEPEGS
jgi:hypothetical protein